MATKIDDGLFSERRLGEFTIRIYQNRVVMILFRNTLAFDKEYPMDMELRDVERDAARQFRNKLNRWKADFAALL